MEFSNGQILRIKKGDNIPVIIQTYAYHFFGLLRIDREAIELKHLKSISGLAITRNANGNSGIDGFINATVMIFMVMRVDKVINPVNAFHVEYFFDCLPLPFSPASTYSVEASP